MKFAFFPGCKMDYYLEPYGKSSRAVLEALGVELVEMEFNCCGYPVRHLSSESFLLAAARNLALAEERQIDLVTPCKCCFGTLKHADYNLRSQEGLRNRVNRHLEQEGLRWRGKSVVKHLLSVLLDDVGLGAIGSRIERPFRRLAVAAHYGCHALRPGNVMGFDNPLAPTIFESLVSVTGARPVAWPRRLECCGAPLREKNDPLSLRLAGRKLADAERAGAALLCTACTYCQIQFDTARSQAFDPPDPASVLPSLVYTQLLGLALGLSEDVVGLTSSQTAFHVLQESLAAR